MQFLKPVPELPLSVKLRMARLLGDALDVGVKERDLRVYLAYLRHCVEDLIDLALSAVVEEPSVKLGRGWESVVLDRCHEVLVRCKC